MDTEVCPSLTLKDTLTANIILSMARSLVMYIL